MGQAVEECFKKLTRTFEGGCLFIWDFNVRSPVWAFVTRIPSDRIFFFAFFFFLGWSDTPQGKVGVLGAKLGDDCLGGNST